MNDLTVIENQPTINSFNQSTEVQSLLANREKFLSLIEQAFTCISDAAKLEPDVSFSFLGDISYYHVTENRFIGDTLKKSTKAFDTFGWKSLLDKSKLNTMLNASQKEEIINQIYTSPLPLTFDNVMSTFKHFFDNRYDTFKKGLVDVFSRLCKKYKSHDSFKIDKNIILSCYNHNVCYDRITDTHRILSVLDNKDPLCDDHQSTPSEIMKQAYYDSKFPCEFDFNYFRARTYKNGNVHLRFKRLDLIDKANQIIADHYGATIGNRA